MIVLRFILAASEKIQFHVYFGRHEVWSNQRSGKSLLLNWYTRRHEKHRYFFRASWNNNSISNFGSIIVHSIWSAQPYCYKKHRKFRQVSIRVQFLLEKSGLDILRLCFIQKESIFSERIPMKLTNFAHKRLLEHFSPAIQPSNPLIFSLNQSMLKMFSMERFNLSIHFR